MAYNLKGKTVAIPGNIGCYSLTVVGAVLGGGGRLVLGAAPEKLELLKGEFRGERNVFCQRLNSSSAQSFRAFFKKAYARFGSPDVVVLRALSSPTDVPLQKQIEHAGLELLLCLDGLAPWIGKEVHIIVIAPWFFGCVAISIATEFLNLKFETAQPVIRMTTVATVVQSDGTNAMASSVIMPTGNQGKTFTMRQRMSRRSAKAPNADLRVA